MTKTYVFPISCEEKVADWFERKCPDEPHDIDPDMTFIDLFLGIKDHDMDLFMACGEDMDLVDDIIEELADRMDMYYSDLREGLFD